MNLNIRNSFSSAIVTQTFTNTAFDIYKNIALATYLIMRFYSVVYMEFYLAISLPGYTKHSATIANKISFNQAHHHNALNIHRQRFCYENFCKSLHQLPRNRKPFQSRTTYGFLH